MSRVVGVIPCHLASVRFPRKILFPFAGLAMVEHVRRRALMAKGIDDVIVATCDDEIEEVILNGGGKVIRTANTHTNGTSRIAEAVKEIDCDHVVLLQGDEPLLLPSHVEALIAGIHAHPEADVWNVTGPIEHPEELDRHSFVKCAVSPSNQILYCFRRSPSTAEFDVQRSYIRKILGLFAFRREVLLKVAAEKPSPVERAESIEQMRLIEYGRKLVSVPVDESLPSVNEPHEADIVLEKIQTDPVQQDLLARVLSVGSEGQNHA